MNTETIITELRLYNRWRRGDEAITAPDPTALGKLIDVAADSLASLVASNTTLRRERNEAREQAATERESSKAEFARSDSELADAAQKESALRARVSELEREIERSAWAISPAMVQARNEQLAARVKELEAAETELIQERDEAEKVADKLTSLVLGEPIDWAFHDAKWAQAIEESTSISDLRAANAELAGALRGAREELYSLREFVIDRNVTDETSDGIQDADASLAKADAALARHAAGEPAKHPDSERLDWLQNGFAMLLIGEDETIREAIDRARKEVRP